jgi:hypothetical protein
MNLEDLKNTVSNITVLPSIQQSPNIPALRRQIRHTESSEWYPPFLPPLTTVVLNYSEMEAKVRACQHN